jgi:citronellol/citronellal dehydrogenase
MNIMTKTQLSGKTALITGASRGIGAAIAQKLGSLGCNVAILAKTLDKHPTLPGSLNDVAENITASGGRALAIATDLRFEDQVQDAVQKTADHFGGIDIVVNNASAIFLSGTEETPMKRFDLMQQVNARATFMTSQKALPFLKQSSHAHILNMSPPLNMHPKWFANNVAYTMAKYGMSMCVLGMAAELRKIPVAVNALWPATAIDTAALRMLGGVVKPENCRTVDIVADAAAAILSHDPKDLTGQFLIDEDILRQAGVTDFDQYAVDSSKPAFKDFFLD